MYQVVTAWNKLCGGTAHSDELAIDETIADSGDEAIMESDNGEASVNSNDEYSDTDAEYSDDDMVIVDSVSKSTQAHLAIATNCDDLAHHYPGVDMGKILAHVTSFFCWTDKVLIRHVNNVYAALPIQGKRGGRWTELLLDGLHHYHNNTFAAAQAMSERLLVQSCHNGLTSPELRQIFDKKTKTDPAATTAQPTQNANIFVGKNIDLVVPSDQRYNYSKGYFVRSICLRDCSTLCKLATPYDSTFSTMASELASKVAADLKTRPSKAAQRRKPYANYGGVTYYTCPPRKGHGIDSLDDWAMDILKRTNTSVSTARVGSWHSNGSEDSGDSEYSNASELTSLEADYVAPSYEAFFLFIAHHVKVHISGQDATGLFKPEDYTDDDNTDIYSAGHDDPTEFANIESSMFALSSSVEIKVVPALHLIVANVEIGKYLEDFNETKLKLVRKTKALFINQHNRRFAWGLAAACHTIHAYVFGPDDIW
ncbi:hypothetical protein GGH94_006036 [Coemansia aciculifera]|uniref:Uncharacterized protein n=1 Tax=Coemansia aciculifera TaxID=417176 RepID=A0A9W8IHB3_9FUNG|nr:hypothetical protein GGH94_006036 [Coemansia aciculifera]